VQRHLHPEGADGFLQKANILWVDGHAAAARNAFREAVRLRPNDKVGLRGIALSGILCAQDLVARGEEKNVQLLSSKVSQFNTRIPQVIHIIWLGTKPPPSCVSSWEEHFAERYPEWRVKVWRDKDIEHFKLKNQVQFEAAKYFAGKADIARLEIVEREGGVYIDADACWLGVATPDELLEESKATGFFAGKNYIISSCTEL
jgi:prepilin-type processing-associated H-X9-DG protein